MRWTSCGILLLLSLLVLAEGGRKKRSIREFGHMIRMLTGHSAMDFNGYGNYCGLGGKGIPVDPIDRCCQQHDMCYHVTNNVHCPPQSLLSLKTRAYTTFYNWILEPGAIDCMDTDPCRRSTCKCDAEAAACFQRNLPYFNNRLKPRMAKFMERVSQIIG